MFLPARRRSESGSPVSCPWCPGGLLASPPCGAGAPLRCAGACLGRVAYLLPPRAWAMWPPVCRVSGGRAEGRAPGCVKWKARPRGAPLPSDAAVIRPRHGCEGAHSPELTAAASSGGCALPPLGVPRRRGGAGRAAVSGLLVRLRAALDARSGGVRPGGPGSWACRMAERKSACSARKDQLRRLPGATVDNFVRNVDGETAENFFRAQAVEGIVAGRKGRRR